MGTSAAMLTATPGGLEQAIAELTTRREQLRTDVAAAEEQRGQVQGHVNELSEILSIRSDELAQVEQRISGLQQRGTSMRQEQNRVDQPQSGQQQEPEDQAAASEQQSPEQATASQEPAQDTGEPTEQPAAEQPAAEQPAAEQPPVEIEPGEYSSGPVIAVFSPDGTFSMANQKRSEIVNGQYVVENGIVTFANVTGDIRLAKFPLLCRIESAEAGFRLLDHDEACGALAGTSFAPIE